MSIDNNAPELTKDTIDIKRDLIQVYDESDGRTKVAHIQDVQRGGAGLFSQTASGSAIVNTTDETTLINGGVGALTIPPHGFNPGDSFVAYFSGSLSANNNETLRIRVKSGSVVLADTGVINMINASDNFYEIHINFAIRAIGPAGTAAIITSGRFFYNKASNNTPENIGFETVESTNFDTTISNTLDVTAEWGTASATNSIDTHLFNLYRLFP